MTPRRAAATKLPRRAEPRMLLPTTYFAALLLLILSMFSWGSWANTQKLVGKWRFELFYYDYSLGVMLCAVVAAFTFGSVLTKELTFQDNLLIAAKRQMAYGVAGGAVFNLGNILLVAAIAVSGMAVAFPIAIGLALVIGVVLNYILNPQGNPFLLFIGAFLVVVAIVVNAFAYSTYLDERQKASKPAVTLDARGRPRPTREAPMALRGILLAIGSGILMGLFYPLVEIGRQGETGVAPYGMALLFGFGVLVSTLLYVPFFATFPVQGQPIELKQYFTGTRKQHLLGVAGGAIWMVGAISNFAAAGTPVALQVGPAVSYALGQGSTLVGALWGLLVWHEFKGANQRIRMQLGIMIGLFVVGLAMISIAPLYAK
jgi:glucose uptake protein